MTKASTTIPTAISKPNTSPAIAPVTKDGRHSYSGNRTKINKIQMSTTSGKYQFAEIFLMKHDFEKVIN